MPMERKAGEGELWVILRFMAGAPGQRAVPLTEIRKPRRVGWISGVLFRLQMPFLHPGANIL